MELMSVNMENADAWSERRASVEPILEKKRFHLATEQFSKERLDALKQGFEEFQTQHPEVISFSLFGSMSKGYAKPDSDIDGWLFVSSEAENAEKLGEKFREVVGKELTGVGLSVFVEPISGRDFDDLLDDMAKTYEGAKTRSASVSIEEAIPYLNVKAERIGKIFMGISFGHGLNEYRAGVLQKLQSLGSFGETVWKEIMNRVRLYERFPRRSDSDVIEMQKGKYARLYPNTLAEAIKVYGKGIPKNESPSI